VYLFSLPWTDQVEVIQDLYNLDLADDWRGLLEQHMLEDTDIEMPYQNAMDGFEDDIELNMHMGLAPMKSRTGSSHPTTPPYRPTYAEAQDRSRVRHRSELGNGH
jgi:hypothetical protein